MTWHTSALRHNVKNPLQLLEDAAVVMESEIPGETKECGDREQVLVFRAARDQLLVRPSDRLAWSIIRWLLSCGWSEADYHYIAVKFRKPREERDVGARVT